jgi:hypothetical protein
MRLVPEPTPLLTELELLAQSQLARGLGLQQRYEDALSHAQRAAALAMELGRSEVEGQMRLAAATTLRLLRRYPDAVAEYERVITLGERLDDYYWVEQALDGLGVVLLEHPETGAQRMGDLAEHFARMGDGRREGICRYRRAICLERMRSVEPGELVAEYLRAAVLLEAANRVDDAGHAYYWAARALSIESLMNDDQCEPAFQLFGRAATLSKAAEKWWLKGLAEQGAGEVLRLRSIPEAPDSRRLPMMRRAARSFAQANRRAEEAGARLTAAIEWGKRGNVRALLRAARLALHSYEVARVHLLRPHERERTHQKITWGFRFLTNQLIEAAADQAVSSEWQPLLWRQEQALKGRSFQDQHTQHENWTLLVAEYPRLRDLTREVDILVLKLEELTTKLDRCLMANNSTHELDRLVGDLEAARAAHADAERTLTRYLDELDRHPSRSLDLASVPPASVADLQAALHPDEAYLGFLWSFGSQFVRFLVEATGPLVVTIQPKPEPSVFDAWLAHLPGSDLGSSQAEEIDQGEIAAVASCLIGDLPASIDTLFVAPEGQLMSVPWHQILLSQGPSGPQSLGQRCVIALTPAAGAIRQWRTEAMAPIDEPYLGIACNGDGRIPGVDIEVTNIARDYFSASGERAYLTTTTCHRFFSERRAVRILHLACHAGRAGLLLSTDGVWTTPIDLIRLETRAHVLLLTGCNAGNISDRDNNEFLGIVRQLLHVTQARAAIVSRAPVPDAAGVIFSDLVISAMTGQNPGRPWSLPFAPLTVGEAVKWARERMQYLQPANVRSLLRGLEHEIRPAHLRWWRQPGQSSRHLGLEHEVRPARPEWWALWLIIGDPRVRIQ